MKIKIEVSAEERDEASVAGEGLDEVLRVVASNPKSSQQMLDAVSASKSRCVRMEAAGNPNASLETLDKLINDEEAEVRAALTQHPDAIQFLWKLVSDRSALVRYCVALNPTFPEHVYQVLSRDENERVARRARRTLSDIRTKTASS